MTYFLIFATSAIVSLVAGDVVRRAAVRCGAVVPPRPDRWHRQPTPTFGGIAVLLGLFGALLVSFPSVTADARTTSPVLLVSLALFGIGWYDDVRPFSAAAKIVNSLAAAAFFVFAMSFTMSGFTPGITSAILSLVAVVWFATLDNSINLLDNMDALAGGVTAIAALGLAVTFHEALGPGLVAILVGLAGALAGFLFWNRPPARLFMGNCGSLAIGGLLAACSTVAIMRTGTVLAASAVVLILVTPLFDTSFVMLLRRMAGRSTTAGFVDHLSHRLVSAGSPEPRTLLILYLLSAAGGGAGFLLQRQGIGTWPIAAVVLLGALMIGLYLARVPAYSGQDFVALQGAPFAPLLSDLTMRWHIGEVLLDLVLIVICYYTAYHLRFEASAVDPFLWSFTASLPLMIGCQIAALYASGLYSRAWSTFGFHDLWPVVRGVGVGTGLAVLLIGGLYKNTHELELFSRAVFVIDAVLLMAAIMTTRLSSRILSRIAAHSGPQKRRVMVYGAGVRGQMLVREMLANPSWLRHPVGYLDDDASKHGRRLLGVPVRGSVQALETLLERYSIEEVLLSSPSINGSVETRIREICGVREIPVRRLYLEIR